MSIQLPSPANFKAPEKNEIAGWLPGFVDALNKFMQQTVTALSALVAARTEFKTLTIATVASAGQIQVTAFYGFDSFSSYSVSLAVS